VEEGRILKRPLDGAGKGELGRTGELREDQAGCSPTCTAWVPQRGAA
jgi:hypothetical protein